VIIHDDTKILASGQNEPVRLKNATRHAEICALDTVFAQYDLPIARKVHSSCLFLPSFSSANFL
jgi:tRNA(Arg) A34 adenosine deaminase TadA